MSTPTKPDSYAVFYNNVLGLVMSRFAEIQEDRRRREAKSTSPQRDAESDIQYWREMAEVNAELASLASNWLESRRLSDNV
jgi:hypothetical protein